MNERIKELAHEAGLPTYNPDGIPTKLEKFAELIVQECVGIVESLPAGYRDYRDQIEDAFRRDCVAELKEHFGVE